MKDKYVKVDLISSFRQSYIIPYEALQEMNEKVRLTDELAMQWAEESVMCEEVKEFSQKWIGENVVDVDIINTEKALELFKRDNKVLSEEWSTSKQLDYINNWKDPLKDKIKKPSEENEKRRTD